MRRKSFPQRGLHCDIALTTNIDHVEIVILFYKLDKAPPDFLMFGGLSGSFRARTFRKLNDAERLELLAGNVTVQKKRFAVALQVSDVVCVSDKDFLRRRVLLGVVP